jgi:hypothetical protein
MARQHGSSIMAGRLQTRFERIERVERKVDREARDSPSLTQSRSVCPHLKGTEKRTMRDLVHRDVTSGEVTSTGRDLGSAMAR